MSPAEVSVRARQHIAKWMDYHLPSARRPPLLEVTRTSLLPSGAFFAGALNDRTPELLDRRTPGARLQIIDSANTIVGRRFELLGYRGLSFGDPIDWQFDPVSGRRAPLEHWSLLEPLDADALGDSKVIWELNRHQWLVRLGQAYRLTGERRFATAFHESIVEWMEANPYGMGMGWASSLEVALRAISWSWALHLFLGAPGLSRDLETRVLGGLWLHAAHVERYLSYYFSPNTHLTGEALGLFYVGVLFPDLPRAAGWRQLGAEILERESTRQILADGVYFEQSTCYQRYTAEIYLHFLVLAGQSGLKVAGAVKDRLGALLDALLLLLRPDRSMPQIGDADGGWLLPLARRSPDDARGVFSTAAVLFNRADYAWAAGGLAPETLWLLGAKAVEMFDSLDPAPPPGAPSRLLPTGGYAVMRNHWGADADQVIFDIGPLGCPVTSGHGHADLLGIQCSFRGRPYVVDPGTFRYTADQGWRAYFRGTGAHSTVEVDGTGQANPRGPFAWDSRPRARFLRWETGNSLDFAEAEHRAYERLSNPVVHRRRVILVKTGYCVVLDDLEGAGEHRLDLRFQFAPMPVTLGAYQWARAGGVTGSALLVRAFATVPLKARVAEGELEPREGWVSTDYGVQIPAPMLVYSFVGRLPARILTLLLASEDLSASPPVSPLIESGALRGLVWEDRHAVLRADGPSPSLEMP